MRTPSRIFLFLFLLASLSLAQDETCESGQVHDDGTAETTWGTVSIGPDTVSHLLSRFTPPTYPYHYDRACAYMFSFERLDSNVDIVVFDDHGPEGAPGTLLEAKTLQFGRSLLGTWVSAHLDCGTVFSGSVWIGVRYDSSRNIAPGADTDGAHPFYSSPDGVDWLADYPVPTTLMIRAGGAPGSVSAAAIPRFGSGVNTPCFSADRPIIGSTWTARVAHDVTALETFVQIRRRGAEGIFLPAGEVLVDLSSTEVYTSVLTAAGGEDEHSTLIPPNTSLIGVTLTSQAAVHTPTGYELCNAYDLTIGCL